MSVHSICWFQIWGDQENFLVKSSGITKFDHIFLKGQVLGVQNVFGLTFFGAKSFCILKSFGSIFLCRAGGGEILCSQIVGFFSLIPYFCDFKKLT